MKRLGIACAALLVWLTVNESASAQYLGQTSNISGSSAGILGGNSPRLQFQQFNTGNIVTPVSAAGPQSVSQGGLLSRIFNRTGSLTSIFPRFGQQGSSNLPPPSAYESTYYPNSFVPLAPIYPGSR
ncbi:hypothetical protein [Tuwongella immobilis]|uniref:Secreted protein n=1 Tax=Tuwongella immobilis TaxID=692036 RepID=A0A6C2YL25_9BACT|nr:hypothetical protein [Tuwongella immobilis]VIP01805.1 unnamed protein product [Tuwongella immobilis]VTR99504.1 unnamed protein product [Tuwongella immobilis]